MYQLRLISILVKNHSTELLHSIVPETIIEIAIYNEVHDAVQNQ